MKPIAYEGNEPYIFISYAHKDSERVFQVLDELDKKGYRIWYDDGIAPGSEWPEDIARHLDGAHMVIAFVTPNSMASQNCRREINFALSKEKPFLSILLEKTQMPLGMEMQLSAQQSILRYNYSTWDAFISKILKCPDIVPCRKQEPEPTPPVQPVQIPQSAAPIPQTMPEPAVQPKETPAPKQKTKPVKIKAPKTANPSKKRNLILIGSIASVVVVLSVVVVILLINSSFKTSWDEKFSRSAPWIIVINKTITQKDLENFSRMKKATSLTFNNCDLSACDFSKITLSPTIEDIEIIGSTPINDFHFLDSLTLDSLTIDGQSGFTDLSLINLDSLIMLSLNNTAVSDISVLQNASKLSKLYISGTEVADLSPLTGLSELTGLDVSYTKVTNIDPIASLENLLYLDISGCSLSSLPDELLCLKLETFYASFCGLKDLKVLGNCTKLKTIDISDNPSLTSFDTVIQQNHNTLTSIHVTKTGLSAEEINTLSQCALLKHLSVSGLSLTSLDFCRNLSALVSIRAEGCGLTDISGLAECTKLTTILLSFNQLTDVSALSSITPDAFNTIIDLSYNQLSNIQKLPVGSYRALLIHGNDPSIVFTLTTEHKASMLSVDFTSDIQNSNLKNKGSFTRIYLTGTPTNQVISVQESLGKSYVELLSTEDLMQRLLNDTLLYELKLDYSFPCYLYEHYK